jgi:MFS family permease
MVTHPWQLYIVYGTLVGVGFGGTSIPLSAISSRWFLKTRGLMSGIAVAGIGTGTMIVPLIANGFLAAYNWRMSFILIGILVIIIGIPAALLLKRDPSKIGESAWGEREEAVQKIQKKSEQGLTFRESLHTSRFWLLIMIFFLFGYYVQSILVHIVPHAKALGIDANSAAFIMTFLGIGSLSGRIVMGGISDRIGVKFTLICALGLILLTFLWLLIAENIWMLYIFALIYGFGYGAMISMQALAPASMFGLLSLGTLFGTVAFLYTCGGAIGATVTGYIYDVTGSYQMSFIIWAVLAGCGTTLALALRHTRIKVTH